MGDPCFYRLSVSGMKRMCEAYWRWMGIYRVGAGETGAWESFRDRYSAKLCEKTARHIPLVET